MSTRRMKRKGRGGRRPGAGRPRVLEDPVKISLVIERRDAEALDTVAEEEQMTFSDYVRAVLRRHIARSRVGED